MVLYDEFCFVGREPPPFIHLAKHVLSISANLASCERLFSVFGNILTKLRNRLGTNNMVVLAELKMHIRDEHAHKQTKKRLKRVFQVRTDAEIAAAASALLVSESARTASLTPQQSVDSPDLSLRLEAMAPEGSEASDNSSSHSRLTNSFRSMVEQQSQLVDDDDTDGMPVRLSTIGPIPLKSLFDFSRSHWVHMHLKSSIRSFDEELQLYEMLDLDAEGELDVDVDVDEDTGDVLMG